MEAIGVTSLEKIFSIGAWRCIVECARIPTAVLRIISSRSYFWEDSHKIV